MSNTLPPSPTEQTHIRKPAVTILKVVLTAVVILFAVVAAWPRARLAVVWGAGRCNACSLRDTLNSHDLLVNMVRDGEQIAKASHILRRDGAFELVQTRLGAYWTVKNDRFLRFTLAEEDLEIYGDDRSGVKPGDIVLDCGANVGVFTRNALKQGAKLVVAIEPAPATVECLRRNFEREIADGRVIICPKGVWDRDDTLELAVGSEGNTTGDSFVLGRDQKNKVKVPLTTIDGLVAELHLPRVDFIKMDIEGAEKQALRGGARAIAQFHPRMAIASEHLPDDVQAIPAVVKSIWPGYRVKSSSCKDDFLAVTPEVLLFDPGVPL